MPKIFTVPPTLLVRRSCVCPHEVVLCSSIWDGFAFVLVRWSCIRSHEMVLCLSLWHGLVFVLMGGLAFILMRWSCVRPREYVCVVGVGALGVKFVMVALALSRWCLWLRCGFWCC
ncbi:hypothetical protein C2G38_2193420 [Gigaspora rosea]|uniref:Transmembrane protein n=1 Tax=Gigaspora rosea TaxID=44941 RepID=A0A397V049_9GLOM|nr:hypothetical protein C2G38_2193420 [Gigaspora rosea]